MPCCSFLFAGWGNFGQRWFHIRGSSRRGWTHSRMQGPQWPSLKFVCSLSFSKPHVFNYVLLYHLWLLDSLFFSLRERVQVEQLIRYIIEEHPEDVENKRTFKLVFLTNYYFFSFLFLMNKQFYICVPGFLSLPVKFSHVRLKWYWKH